MDASMKRNLDMFGKNFLKLPENIKQTLPSIQNIPQGNQVSQKISQPISQTPQNPLASENTEKQTNGIVHAYAALKGRDAQIRKAL
jgi:CRISPR/Cas system CMR-associated protein Cmr3 (group 5 of RAMP superfamily)